jgi:N-ethylmaleimide reductase
MTDRPSPFQPVQLGALTLRNRIVMAPMTRNRVGKELIPGAMNVEYYAQRASAGLIISEGSQVSAQGVGYAATPGIHSAEQVAGWRLVTDAVHARGGRIFLQLWHVGRVSHPSLQPDGALPVAPSAIAAEGFAFTYSGMQPLVTPRALEAAELPGIVEQFRHGARMALEAGFDGVEIHGANGYLLDQFLESGSNARTDAYGGSPENRARLLLEVTAAVAEIWGADRVGVRLSPLNAYNSMSDADPAATFGYAAEAVGRLGIAYLHVVEPREPMMVDGTERSAGEYLGVRFGGTLILNGGLDLERAEALIASGKADLVSFGRLFLANPDLPERFAAGAALNTPDPATFYGGDARGYIDYPALAG